MPGSARLRFFFDARKSAKSERRVPGSSESSNSDAALSMSVKRASVKALHATSGSSGSFARISRKARTSPFAVNACAACCETTEASGTPSGYIAFASGVEAKWL